MKLEVGMYVRHKSYGIGKIINGYKKDNRIWFGVIFKCYEGECHCGICEQSIGFKASKDILDLIEKDDVVAYYNSLQDIKGLIIERVQDNDYIKRLREFVEIGTINIVRVMTKEQFEQYSYKIGE